eukprot:scaffold23803_cov132-Cylindrotheca_fusiformis.AAC.7
MCRSGAGMYAMKEGDDFEQAAIIKVERMLVQSMSELPTAVPFEAEDCTRLARIIYSSMTTNGRVYHSMSHVFDISATMKDPVLVLSALCHDLIYFQIDKAFDEDQSKALEGVVLLERDPLALVASIDDPVIESVIRLFGYAAGAELTGTGTNEFLSALLAASLLKQWLAQSYLIQIATCIEATIPFRPIVEGKSPMERLYDRLVDVASDQTEEWLQETMNMAVITANCDLCSFDSSDLDFFLDSSWKLIPEARPALLEEDCPLAEYLLELHCLAGRSNFLKGAVPRIFQSFRQVPTDAEMEKKRHRTDENLKLVIAYGNVRLLQLMVLVEFVAAAGEDPASVPLRSFLRMGIAETTEASDNLTFSERQIRHWLANGRKTCFPWDPSISPLGRYLFDALGTKGIAEAVKIGKNQKPGSSEILKYLPESVVRTVGESLATLFPDKAGSYLQVLGELGL